MSQSFKEVVKKFLGNHKDPDFGIQIIVGYCIKSAPKRAQKKKFYMELNVKKFEITFPQSYVGAYRPIH